MRVRWNRQLDGSLNRKQVEEEAAVADEQPSKDKHKSTPKIFRIFRRKKHHRRADDSCERNPETPFEADDEDCASISSVASQPVTELCHRDRTVSLFSSFRLNFPGGKKKSKRGGGAPLFPENESENNRYSSPDLMREKLGAATCPQTELSKSSPSVRNTSDSATSIPGDFRVETSVSYQQLKHDAEKNSSKLAKSVSFSDCQATLNSKQVICASARALPTSSGQTEKCLPRSADIRHKVCENKLPRNDSLRLPTEPSFWKSDNERSKVKVESAMSEIVSSSNRWIDPICNETRRDKYDVRGKWFSETQRSDRDLGEFEKGPETSENCPLSDKPVITSNVNSKIPCYSSFSRDMCSTKLSLASGASCDLERELPCTHRISPAQSRNFSDKVGDSEQVLNFRKALDESDLCDKLPYAKYASSLKDINVRGSNKHAFLVDASEIDVDSSEVKVQSVLQNCNDFIYASTPSERKRLCNGDLETSNHVNSNSVKSDVSCFSNNNTYGVNNLDRVPDSEKRLLNEMLRSFELNTDENGECGVSLSPNLETNDDINKNSPKVDIISDSTLPLIISPLGYNALNFDDYLSHQHLLDVSCDNLSVSCKLKDVHSLANNSLDNLNKSGILQTSEIPDFIPSIKKDHVINENNTLKTVNARESTSDFKLNQSSLPVVKDDVEENSTNQHNTFCGSAVADNNITVGEIFEQDFSSDILLHKENNLITRVVNDFIEKSNSCYSELENEKLSVSQTLSPLFSIYLKSNNFVNGSLLDFNFLNLVPENINLYSLSKKSSVFNLSCPIHDVNDLNNNLCDADSYLYKLTETGNDSTFPFQMNPDSNKYAKRVAVWNASFVQNLSSPSEILPIQQQSIDSSGGCFLSHQVPSSYPTLYGKERCPDVTSPSGCSSDIVTLQGSDLHIAGDGNEILDKEGGCVNEKSFLSDDEMKETCDSPHNKNLVSLLNESCDSFTKESFADCEIVLPGDWCVTKQSSDLVTSAHVQGSSSGENTLESIALESERMHYGDDSSPVSDLISNGYYSGGSLMYETDDVYSNTNSHESANRDQVAENSVDLLSQVVETVHEEEISDELSISNSEIPNEYHSENDASTEFLHEICVPSELDEQALDGVTDDFEINNVKEKIQFFENGSVECCDNKTSYDVKTTTRKKSFERRKNSKIPSLKKACLEAVNEKKSKKTDSIELSEEIIFHPGFDLSRTKPKTVDEFGNILVSSDGHALVHSSNVSDENWSLELECDSGANNENHFVIDVDNSSLEFSKLYSSEELLSSLPSKTVKCKSRLQTRRHSSIEANASDIAREGCKESEKGLTTDFASPVNLNPEKEASESSLKLSSNLTLCSVKSVQGQPECGLQSRCVSLPLVSPLRRNCPIKDASRGKSRIPRKRGSLHTKPVRPPSWLSKAELTAEIQRLGTLCEARTKELNRLKMETKHVSVGFDAFASLFKYLVEDLNAMSMPMLAEDLKKTLKQLELAKQDLAYYEREVEEMKAHHCQELNDLSNKLFEVFHGEVTELSAKHQEEMNHLKSDHQQQIENLSTTFNATSQETISKHEAAVVRLQQEIISQREELQQLHEREIADLEAKHSQDSKTLQEHIEQMQKKCAELKQHSMGMEDAMRKDTDTKLQWVTSRKVDLEKEVESLKAVLEMKNKELHTLRVQNLEMEKQLEELPLAREKIKMLQARAEDLEALMIEKTKLERKLCRENQQILTNYEKESKVNKRLSLENEELLWRIRQAEQSFISDSFSVAEYPEDVENGSISPTKSPPHLSRSVFFTYIDKEDQTSSPKSQYKKITPGFAAGYKTSPYKSPPASSPRRAKSHSEPPQPHSCSTPRKGSKHLKQKKRSGSDCGKVNGDQVEGAFLSVAGSMTSSVSSESSVCGERLLEEHKEQILESLEILREQQSMQNTCSAVTSRVESDDMSRSAEFSDPKNYYHMTFPVSGIPDCDINVTAQAIHSTSESTSPLVETQPIVPLQKSDICAGNSENANSLGITHSFKNVSESECKKKSKENRWRTI